MSDSKPPETPEEAKPDTELRPILIQTALGLAALFLVVATAAWLFKPQMEQAGAWFVETFGWFGCFVGVLLSDTFAIPIPPDTYVIVAVTSKLSPYVFLPAVCVASLLGGQLAYKLGPWLSRWSWIRIQLDRFRTRGEALFARWGVLAIVLAALTPIPFSPVCWLAGIFQMDHRAFSWATLCRIPRFVIYYAFIAWGWAAGGSL